MGLFSYQVQAQYSPGKCIKFLWSDSTGVAIVTVIDSCLNDTIWVGGIPYGGEWTFEALGCLKIHAYPPVWTSQPDTVITIIDTIYWPPGDTLIVRDTSIVNRPRLTTRSRLVWEDTCQNNCIDTLTIPLGCYETRTETLETGRTVTVCDTTYYALDTLITHYDYWLIEGIQYLQLTSAFGCTKPQSSSQQIKLVKKGYRWYGLILDNVPFAYPVDDSCWISPNAFPAYELVWGFYGAGLWKVDSTSQSYGQRIVDASYWGQPGVLRDTSNCRTETLTNTVIRTFEEWVYSGRDTTVINYNCDPCLEPYFICQGGALDSLRNVEYIYSWTTEPDTIKAPCPDDIYFAPVVSNIYWVPPEKSPCTTDPAIIAWVNANWLGKGVTSWSPGRVAVTNYTESVCRDCQTSTEPPALSNTRYFLPSDIDPIFPCQSDTCQVDIDWVAYEGVCCSKDTTVSFYCYEGNTNIDSTTITYSIPDITGPCADSVIIGIVPGDTTWVIVDSVVTWIHFWTPRTYRMAWRDTCECIPTLNGREFCEPYWIVRDCDPPVYWGTDGKLHIPCEEGEPTDLTDVWDAISARAAQTQDSLRILRRKLDSLQSVYDAITPFTPTYAFIGIYDGGSPLVIELTDADTYYDVTGFTVRTREQITADTTNGAITLSVGGTYQVIVGTSFEASKNGDTHIDVGLGDGTEFPWIELQRSITSTATGNANMHGFIVVDGGTEIKVRVKHSAAATDITFQHLQINITLIKPD